MASGRTDASNLGKKSVGELLREFAAIMRELQNRGVTRTANNPVADIAESLVAEALGLTLATGSTAGHDAVDSEGMRYQIKARRLTGKNTSRQMSTLRRLNDASFEYLVGVLFNEDFSVHRACLAPHSCILIRSAYRKHVNGHHFHLRDEVWDDPLVRDITELLRNEERQRDSHS